MDAVFSAGHANEVGHYGLSHLSALEVAQGVDVLS